MDITTKDIWPLKVSFSKLNWRVKPEDRSDAFFEKHYADLFINIFDLADDTFGGCERLQQAESPWAAQHPPEFFEYVKVVAGPDPNMGQWENMLRIADERVFLLTGVIMRAIDANVLSSLLFGASDKHREALDTQDVDLVNFEGQFPSPPLSLPLWCLHLKSCFMTDLFQASNVLGAFPK